MNNDKATLVFTPLAWTKMWALVDHFDSEVAWNGLCRRGEAPQTYVVEDILVHKQMVTGGTVRSDSAEYDEWLNSFDDETFERIRLHGHSHYRMQPFASALDRELQDDIISQLCNDMFYVFMIVNRRREMWARIVDTAVDAEFSGGAVCWTVQEGDFTYGKFIRQAEDMVTEQPRKEYQHGSGKKL